tara:strand:- start:1340 stop:1546 length:207 start_codon:yes stop_codon:yes gene_type:complete
MKTDSTNRRIANLHDQHQRLDNAVTELEKIISTEADIEFKIHDLKKKKLSVKDEITFLERQQSFNFME